MKNVDSNNDDTQVTLELIYAVDPTIETSDTINIDDRINTIGTKKVHMGPWSVVKNVSMYSLLEGTTICCSFCAKLRPYG